MLAVFTQFVVLYLLSVVADTGGVAMVLAETLLKIARTPNLLTSHHVGDKIATSYI